MADESNEPDDFDDLDEEPDSEFAKPDASVTAELFKAWRSPRPGRANPERMNNPVWEWLIRSRLTGYAANQEFEGPSSFDAGPCWCFKRFGQSKTQLPDGRIVLIAGEHEDSYDPDFYIYNDVVVKNPDCTLEIYGYPKHVFPPTDFHSATLVGDRIVLIGSLGYQDDRRPGATQVYGLVLPAFAFSEIKCIGNAPGWLHRHSAEYVPDENTILITGGLVHTGDEDRQLPENIDDWKLHLSDWRWERLTRRQWKRWNVRRQDRKINDLFKFGSAYFWKTVKHKKQFEEELGKLRDELGFDPDFDLFADLYNPPIAHEKLPERKHEYRISRIVINGVTVRYVEDIFSICMTIEGDLPASTAEMLTSDLLKKLSALERVPYELIRL